jgi:hypothetical protein
MPYPYSQGDKVLASEYNEVVKAAGLYAADAGGTDAYAITVTPAPSSYISGMGFHFKANTANTGPATLNVNGLGAKTLKKFNSGGKVDLETGDILVSQPVDVIYDGVDMVVLSRLASENGIYNSGSTSKNISDASTTQNIPHGLNRVPKYVRLFALWLPSSASPANAFLQVTYNGTITTALGVQDQGTGSWQIETGFNLRDITNGSANYQAGIITFDATNIIIDWTKNGAPVARTHNIAWETWA